MTLVWIQFTTNAFITDEHNPKAVVGGLRFIAKEIARGYKQGHKSDVCNLEIIGGEIFDVTVALINPTMLR